MLERLHQAIQQLPVLLQDTWESLDIDYHPPRVERLFRPFGEGRLYLHRVHPCRKADALFHPHPWPCAIRVLSGRYEMGMGVGRERPVVASRLIATGPFDYEMTDRDAWHYVRAIGAPALSIMVTGAPWDRASPRPDRPLRPLTKDDAMALQLDVRLALEAIG